MKNKNNLYVGLAYSALDVGQEGVMSQEWAEIGGHKCLGSFLLEKVEDKKMFKKPEFKGFKEFRTQQEVHGTDNTFSRPDDLPLASECNEVFLTWFIAPLQATDNMIDVDQYMNLSMGDIMNSLRAVEEVYQAGAKKEDIDLTQEHMMYMK
mgnify:CR=1 FL=1